MLHPHWYLGYLSFSTGGGLHLAAEPKGQENSSGSSERVQHNRAQQTTQNKPCANILGLVRTYWELCQQTGSPVCLTTSMYKCSSGRHACANGPFLGSDPSRSSSYTLSFRYTPSECFKWSVFFLWHLISTYLQAGSFLVMFQLGVMR